MESISRQSGMRHPGLDPLPMPEEGAHLVRFVKHPDRDEFFVSGWFGELACVRQSGFGMNPISYSEILAWAYLTRRSLTPFEVSALRGIDAVFMAVMNESEDE